MGGATLGSTAEEKLIATWVNQNAIGSGAVFNNIGPQGVIQVIHHLKPEATDHLPISENEAEETN